MSDKKYTENTNTDLYNGLLANTDYIKPEFGVDGLNIVDNEIIDSESVDDTKQIIPQSNNDNQKTIKVSEESPIVEKEYTDSSSESSSSVNVRTAKKKYTESSHKTPKMGGSYEIDVENYKRLDPYTQRQRKMEIYDRLIQIKTKGIELSGNYSMNSSYEELLMEYELQKNKLSKKHGTAIAKNFFKTAIYGLEMLNKEYDPFGLELDGFSEQINMDMDEPESGYDDVLGEIYEKYRGRGKQLEPELRLLLMIGGSAASIHMSNRFNSKAGLDAAINKNPDILNRIRKGFNKQLVGNTTKPQEDDNLKKLQREREMYEKMQAAKNNQPSINKRVMKRPTDLDNILGENKFNKLTDSDSSSNNRIKEKEIVNSDELTTTFGTDGKKKKRKRIAPKVPKFDF